MSSSSSRKKRPNTVRDIFGGDYDNSDCVLVDSSDDDSIDTHYVSPSPKRIIRKHNNKRQKKFKPDDLICPITTELPFDPVTAEDGRTYERAAIVEHIKTRQNDEGELRSPITNEPMGSKLLPNIQIRNLIESLIDSGVLTGELADQWSEKMKEQKAKEDLIKKANNGDVDAMYDLGKNYYFGLSGFEKDYTVAFAWVKKSHEAGDFDATSIVGSMLLSGQGVEGCIQQGLLYLGLSAGGGSKIGAHQLGYTFALGKHGTPVNTREAIRWLKKSIRTTDPEIRGLNKKATAWTKQKLAELHSLQDDE